MFKIGYLPRRLLQTVPTLLGILTINFFILHLAPGDVADVLAGQGGAATPEYMDALRRNFGLDQPLYIQYVKYILQVAQLDLGISQRYNMPVATLILSALPVTAILMVTSMAIAVAVGVILGVVAAGYVDTVVDWAISVVGLFSYSVPLFWLSQMLILIFAIYLGLLPSGSFTTVGADLSGLAYIRDVAWHMILPVTVLALFYIAVYSRLTRASMLEVYNLDFVRTARAKGLSSRTVTVKHVLRNALLPVVTMAGVQFGSLLGGAVVIEQVFSLPGLGRLAFDSVLQRDFNTLLSVLLMSSVLVIAVNMLVDFIYVLVDPRIELR
jgi:peptide/nickel transport system permease protein